MIGDFDDYAPTTHDTPEAALAAALPNVPTIKYVIARGGRYNGAWWDRFASEVLAALDGWTLVPVAARNAEIAEAVRGLPLRGVFGEGPGAEVIGRAAVLALIEGKKP